MLSRTYTWHLKKPAVGLKAVFLALKERGSILQQTGNRRAMDQGRQNRSDVDPAFLRCFQG